MYDKSESTCGNSCSWWDVLIESILDCLAGCIAMDQTFSHQNEEHFLTYDIPDEELEVIGMQTANAITLTQWICTALYFCPGP
jgi:hypothetical protein